MSLIEVLEFITTTVILLFLFSVTGFEEYIGICFISTCIFVFEYVGILNCEFSPTRLKRSGLSTCSLLVPLICMNINSFEANLYYAFSTATSFLILASSLLRHVSNKLQYSSGWLQQILILLISCLMLLAYHESQFLSSMDYMIFRMFHPFARSRTFLPIIKLCSICFVFTYLLLRNLSMSFTFGESLFCSQVLTICWNEISKVVLGYSYPMDDLTGIILSVTLLASVLFMLFDLPSAEKKRKFNLIWLPKLLLSLCCSLSFLTYCLEENPLYWVLAFITRMRYGWTLLAFWMSLFLLSVSFAAIFSVRAQLHFRSRTRIRKIFHLLITAVFLSGLLLNARVLSLASSACLMVLAIVEYSRMYRLPLIGTRLDDILKNYRDKQDSGVIILTPIYLLLSMAFPLWIYPGNILIPDIRLFSGVLVIGVGDTVASVYGSKFGKLRLRENGKSIDATVMAILAVIGVTYYLDKFAGVVLKTSCYWEYAMIVSATMSLELFTSQIDNLVLSPFFFGCLTAFR